METIKKAFSTLADTNRLKIINAISENEMAVGELVKVTSLSQPLVSFHLKVLKQNGFMTTRRKGPFIYYSLADVRLLHAIELFTAIFAEKETETDDLMFLCPVCQKRKTLQKQETQ
jgi:DNA-binding transcriptional ArsR family regulator